VKSSTHNQAGTGYVGKAFRVPNAESKSGKASTAFATSDDALAAAGRGLAGATLAAAWSYHTMDGAEVMCVGRFNLTDGSKQFRPVHLASDGWRIGDPPGLLPLYGAHELPADGRVYVCEGEKATDAARAIGLPTVTSAHGSASAARSDWTPLAGREVVILPDNDGPGEKYARDVSRLLVKLDPAARVKIVELPELPPAGDIVEYVAARAELAAASIASSIVDLADAAAILNPAEIVGGPVLICLADVEAREIEWLWPGRVALGRITLLVGKPGEGKSFLTTDMAARISTGTRWPDGSECPAGSVILVSAEDDPGDTIKPRLDAHHADARRVHLLSAVRRIDAEGKQHDVLFTLEDVAALEAALKQHPDCKLIVVDPIGSFLGGDTDSHRDNEVRGVLAPVAMLAEKYGPAVLVVAHRRKGGGGSADDAALGSRAFTGIARAVWHLSRDGENPRRRLLLAGKNNLAPEGDGLAFNIVGEPPAIEWEGAPVKMSADEAFAIQAGGDEQRPGPDPAALNEASEWLADALLPKPLSAAEVIKLGKAAGHAEKTIRRAKGKLGIAARKCGMTGGWVWEHPGTAAGAIIASAAAKVDAKMANPLRENNPAIFGNPDHLGDFDSASRVVSVLSDGITSKVAESSTLGIFAKGGVA
jgi:hypothetical protein